MSWMICVMDLPSEARTMEDIPADFAPQPLGQRHQMIERILEVVPFADFSDPSWGSIETPDFVIEVMMGQEELESFAFRIHGGDAAISMISDMLAHLGLRAIDPSDGSFFETKQALQSLRTWRDFRNRVIADVCNSEQRMDT